MQLCLELCELIVIHGLIGEARGLVEGSCEKIVRGKMIVLGEILKCYG